MGLGSKQAKGIQIEIGGNATGLKVALDQANKAIKSTQSELDTLKNSLKLEWNEENFKRAQELAQRAVQQTTEKAEHLKKALAELDKQGDKKNAEQYEAIKRELSYVQVAAQKARQELSDINRMQFSQLEASVKKLDENIELARASASTAKAELKSMRETLDGEWSLVHFNQAQKAAQENVQKTKQYVDALKEKITILNSAGGDFKTKLEIEQLKKELIGAEAEAGKADAALREINNIPFDRDAQALKDLRQETAGLADESERAGESASNGVQALAAALAAAGVAGGVKKIADALRSCVEASMAFETAMAGVRRTVGGSDAELTALAGQFKAMALEIPTTTTELGKIAETAGQLGIARENVERFTKIMAMLSTTTDLTADSAATMLAQFANITGTQDYERLGATVASLGDATATTASKVVEMAQGMAAAADIAGFQETDILAVAAAVGSLGIESQAGSTALATLISNIYKSTELGGEQLEKFASVSGMSAEQFKKAWQTDAAKALDAFIHGLNNVERNGKSAVVLLDELGITNVRQTKAILGLANAGDLLTRTIAQANQAWEENTALQKKAGVMYATTESKVKMAENAFGELKAAIGDALTPALGELAEAGKDAFSWAADWVEKNPEVVQGLTAVVAMLGTLLISLTAISAVLAAIKALGALGVSTGPVLAISAALAGLAFVISSIVLDAGNASNAIQDMADSMAQSKKEFTETAAGLEQEKADTLALISTLETLAGVENKSAAQKGALLSLVDQLNEAMPELNLAYDEQADKLTGLSSGIVLTTDAIRELALAEAERAEKAALMERLSQLYLEQDQLNRQLGEAELALEAAQARKNQMLEDGTYGMADYQAATLEVDAALLGAQKAVDDLNALLADNAGQVEAVERQYRGAKTAVDEGSAALDKHTASLDENTAAHKRNAEAAEEAAGAGGKHAATLDKGTDSLGKHTKALELDEEALSAEQIELNKLAEEAQALGETTNTLRAETELLSSAFAEQSKTGALSLDTTMKLVDAGYAAALSIDQETGAVRLDTEAYYSLASAKLEEQLSSTQDAIRENMAEMLALEGAAALTAASGFMDLASSIQASADAAKGNLAVLYTNFTALQKMKENLGTVVRGSWSSPSAARPASSGSAGQSATGKDAAKTEAEKRVEAYREALEELDYLRDMDKIDEEAYYGRLAELRDKYLEENSSEWRKANVTLHNWQKQRGDNAAKEKEAAYQEQLDDLKYFLNMDLITEEEYYRKLQALRDEYLKEDTDAWKRASEELYNYRKQQRQAELDALKESLEAEKDAIEGWYDSQTDALKDAYSKQKDEAKNAYQAEKDAAKEAYEARKNMIKSALLLEKQRLNAILEGIDKEIQARRELREDEDQDDAIAKAQKRLAEAKAHREYDARTDEDRVEWDKEIVRLEQALQDALQEKDDTAFYRQKELEKEQVKGQIDAAQSAADQQLSAAEADYKARVSQLETAYQARLQEMETAYQASLEQLRQEYERRLREAEQAYQKAVEALEKAIEKAASSPGKGDSGGSGKHQASGGSSGGGGGSSPGKGGGGGGKRTAAAASAAMARAASAAGAVYTSSSSSVVNNRSANITIHQAQNVTQGMIAGAVRKALDEMSR